MPIYEYRCQTCGVRFEQLVRFDSNSEPPTCPFCRSLKVERLISTFSGKSLASWDGFRSFGGG